MRPLSQGALYAWKIAALEARSMGAEYIEKEHLLIGILSLEKVTGASRKESGDAPADSVHAEWKAIVDLLFLCGHDPRVLRRLMRRTLPGGRQKNDDVVIHRDESCRGCFTRAEYFAREKIRANDLLSATLEQPGELISAVLAESRQYRAASRDSDFILSTGTGLFFSDMSRDAISVQKEHMKKEVERFSADLNEWSPRSTEHGTISRYIRHQARWLAELALEEDDTEGLLWLLRHLLRIAAEYQDAITACIRAVEDAEAKGAPLPPKLKQRIRDLLRRIGQDDDDQGDGGRCGGICS